MRNKIVDACKCTCRIREKAMLNLDREARRSHPESILESQHQNSTRERFSIYSSLPYSHFYVGRAGSIFIKRIVWYSSTNRQTNQIHWSSIERNHCSVMLTFHFDTGSLEHFSSYPLWLVLCILLFVKVNLKFEHDSILAHRRLRVNKSPIVLLHVHWKIQCEYHEDLYSNPNTMNMAQS